MEDANTDPRGTAHTSLATTRQVVLTVYGPSPFARYAARAARLRSARRLDRLSAERLAIGGEHSAASVSRPSSRDCAGQGASRREGVRGSNLAISSP